MKLQTKNLNLFSKTTLRHWKREPKNTLLLITVLALGVGVFLSIRLANRAAVSGFTLFTDSIAGESDFIVRAPIGDLPVSILPEIRDALGPLPVGIHPIIETTAARTAKTEASLYRLVGVDLVSLNNAVYLEAKSDHSKTSPPSNQPFDVKLGDSRLVLIGETMAASEGLKVGDVLPLILDDRRIELEISAILPNNPLRASIPENLILFDLPGLQKLIGKPDKISRVELKIPPGEDRQRILAETKKRLSEIAETQFAIDTPSNRESSAEQMTAAFRLNLTILSTLALIVGVYLIFQALEASVVKRRPEIAILRSLGVESWRIQRAWLFESLIIGMIGSAFGILLGYGMAQLAVGSIAMTVNTLYFENTTTAARLDSGEALFAFLFGLGSSLVAGAIPAREAAATPPSQSLKSGVRSMGLPILRKPIIGVVFVVAAIALSQLPPIRGAGDLRIPLGGYLGALFWLLGLSILAGLLFPTVRKVLMGFSSKNAPLKYAASQFRNPGGRHRLTAAGLLVAVGMAAGMAILVASFEHTLTGWIKNLLKADLYVATAGTSNIGNENLIREDTWKVVAARPEVEGVDIIRRQFIRIDGKETWLAGSVYNQNSDRRLRLIWVEKPTDPNPENLNLDLPNKTIPVWISETFGRRFSVGMDDTIELPIPDFEVTGTVKGIYADYGNERGMVVVHRDRIVTWFGDESVNNVAVYLNQGTDPETARTAFKKEFPNLVIRTNEKLRNESLTIFHRTFSVTYALEAIAIFVAVAGLGMALAGLLIDRKSELTTLKEIGFTRRQIATATLWEGLGLGIVGTLGGLILSLALGHLLIFVVNRQSFGWTLDYQIPLMSLLSLGALTIATSGIVAFCVGWFGAKLRREQEG